MLRLLSRKYIILFLSLIVLIVIIALVYLIYFQNFGSKSKINNQEVAKLSQDIQSTVEKNTTRFNQSQVKSALDLLNNSKLSDTERFKGIKDISFYYQVAYAASHDPKLREQAEILADFAKTNFPQLYEERFFRVGCADPECGEEMDSEFKQIQQEIIESGIPAGPLNTITKNFEQSIYIPNEEIDDKKYGFELVVNQLRLEDNPKASATAEHLVDYVKRKYSIELIDLTKAVIKEPEKL